MSTSQTGVSVAVSLVPPCVSCAVRCRGIRRVRGSARAARRGFFHDTQNTRNDEPHTAGGKSHLNSQCAPSHQPSLVASQVYISRPQIMCDYPLNLSILIRGGKETNKDSLSSCERNGKSSARRGDALVYLPGSVYWRVRYLP